jgi:uncharacterized protein (TIGR00369 family)
MARYTVDTVIEMFNKDKCQEHLGIRATKLDDQGAEMILTLQDWHVNFEGCVHGGILFSSIDSCMGMSVVPHLEDDERILAIDLKINYLKGGTLDMKDLLTRANLVSRTRRLAVSEGEILGPDGTILSKALGTFAILKDKKED